MNTQKDEEVAKLLQDLSLVLSSFCEGGKVFPPLIFVLMSSCLGPFLVSYVKDVG